MTQITGRAAALIVAVMIGLPFALMFLPAGFIVLIPFVLWALPKDIADDLDGGWGGRVGPIRLTRRTLAQLELLANSNSTHNGKNPL